jgi:hypothetical protein
MAIPSKAIGYGNNSTARNVFRCSFSTALSSLVKYEAYDSAATYPAIGSATTVTGKSLAGTAGNGNISMAALVDTSNAAPTSAWLPGSATGGSANPNRLKGQTNYVTQVGSVVGAGGAITWNEAFEMPSDVIPTDNLTFDLLLRYTYTGGAPTLTWSYNEGSEGTPSWTTLTPNTHGIRPCNSGTVAGTYRLDIPPSGVVVAAEGWVTAN